LERESGLSFLEFNYMLLQAYDFYHLAEHYQCLLQLGGSDQWGNMVMGVDLVRRLLQKEAVGLTVPLLTTSSGKKMGKTAQGAIWLDSTLCTPYDYWQYWRNTEDADTGRFLRALTDLSVQEIERLEREYEGHPNELKKVLATECTALVHGREAALEASERAKQRFESDEAETSATIHRIDDCPPEGIEAYRLLQLLGWVTSGGEARKAIRSGQVRLDGAVVTDECHRILPAMFAREGGALVQWGKKKIVRCLATLIV
jgi:tyrosyl-tRNA synthetase